MKPAMIVMGVIIGLLVLINIIGGTSSELIRGANAVDQANNCTEVGDFFNASDSTCYNSDNVYTATLYELPLNNLFSSTGVVMLVLMISLFVFALIFIIRKGMGGSK